MAIISLSGRQYLVGDKEKFKTLKIDKKEGESFELKDELSGKSVKLKVVRHSKEKKIRVFKFKKKTNYKRTYGERMSFTELETV